MQSNGDRVVQQVQQWRDDLVNLTRQNKLLYFKHTKSSSLELSEPASVDILRVLESRPGRLEFFEPNDTQGSKPGDQAALPIPTVRQRRPTEVLCQSWIGSAAAGGLRSASKADLFKILRNLDRQARAEFMDKGLQSLYLALGLLEWIDPKAPDETNLSPLILVPVELVRTGPGDPFRLQKSGDDAIVNPALQLKMDSDFGVGLSNLEDDDLDLGAYFDSVRAAIGRQRDWRVLERTVLARFSFQKEVMYRDLMDNEQAVCAHPLVRALADSETCDTEFDFDPPDDGDLDRLAPEINMVSILDADATQRRCIWSAREGRTFVMDGPPGTGKSQTIANMIAELLAAGRTVLFVSQKAAALEVVHSRLKRFQLDEYVLQLHSHKATRREVAKQLSDAVSRRPQMDGVLAREQIAELQRTRAALNTYAMAMNERREPLGRSLFDVIGRASALNRLPRPAVQVGVDASLTAEKLAGMRDAADALSRSWGPVERGDRFVWRDLSVHSLDAAVRARLAQTLGHLKSANSGLALTLRTSEEALYGWTVERSIAGLRCVSALLAALKDSAGIDPLWLTLNGLDQLDAAVSRISDGQKLRAGALADLSTALGVEVYADRVDAVAAQGMVVQASASAAAGWQPAGDLDESSLHAIATRADAAATALSVEAAGLVSTLCAATGLQNLDDPTVDEATDLIRLLRLAEQADKPEPDWLNSVRVAELRRAEEVLSALVSDIAERRARVDAVFTDKVMELDALSLKTRFLEVHVGLGRLAPASFRDRKALAGCTRSGKFSTEAVGLLGAVSELQGLSRRLSGFERESGSLLGEYYSGSETDVRRLSHALQLAETALAIVGNHVTLADALGVVARRFELNPTALLKAGALDRILTEGRFFSQQVGLDPVVLAPMRLSEAAELVQKIGSAADAWASSLGEMSGRGDSAMTVGKAQAAMDAAQRAVDILRSIADSGDELQAVVGSAYRGLETDVDAVRSLVDLARPVVAALSMPVSLAAAERVLAAKIDSKALDDDLRRWHGALDDLLPLFTENRRFEVAEVLGGSPEEAGVLLEALESSSDDILEWFAFQDALERLSALGLRELAKDFVESGYPATELGGIVERVALETWIDSVIASDAARLEPLRSRDRNALRAEFVALDKKLVHSAAGRVMSACNSRRPVKNVGGVAIILREGEKKKRHMPIRELLSRTRADALALKPCFMMSPLSVSQFLPSDFHFDVVLFDEASQIRPHDAINCIYRGTQHVIAGDQQQLPPTTFFDSARDEGDEWNEDDLEVYESILDKAKSCASIPSLPLLWHYRSRHEDLITYSNVSFYGGRLVSFPSPSLHGPTLGVGFKKVAGVYRRGTSADNPIEAAAVAKLVAHYAKNHPSLTLGVVAFSSAQEEAIENAIEELRIQDPSIPDAFFSGERLDGFFVKNLETVQGDERDVIILSVGYGPDAAGKVYANFGPINLAGGYRRLNVAVTRARMRLELVTSITAGDISNSTASEGAQYLRRYLDYAENGPSVLASNDGRSLGDVESPFEDEVARTIRSWGYDVTTQLGCATYRIDLAVVHPDQPGRHCLAIECDGAMYHSSKVARDRDRLRDAVMQGLGWQIHRIWGPSWYRERVATEAHLRSAIEDAIAACGHETPAAVAEDDVPEVTIGVVEPEPGFGNESWVQPYRVSSPALSVFDRGVPMGDRSASRIMIRLLPEVVRCEQPVHRELALERLRRAWGVGRAGQRIRDEFDTAVRALKHQSGLHEDADGFLWMDDARVVECARQPVAGDDRTERSCSQVCPAEFDFAVTKVVEGVSSIGEHQLQQKVAEIFGWERVGADIGLVITRSVDRVRAAGGLTCDIVPDAGLPKGTPPPVKPPSPPEPLATTRAPEAPRAPAGTVAPWVTNQMCALCSTRIGDRSKPCEVRFFDAERTRTASAHQSCLERLSRGGSAPRGYRWERVREGFVPVKGSEKASPPLTHGRTKTAPPVVPVSDHELIKRFEDRHKAQLEENKKKHGGLYDSSPFD